MRNKNKVKKGVFNKPLKIGLAFAGIGATLDIGTQNIYDYIQNENLIFWLEIVKNISYIIGVLFGVGGVFNSAIEINENATIGKEIKDIASKDLELKNKPKNTKILERQNKDRLNKLFDIIKDNAIKKLKRK